MHYIIHQDEQETLREEIIFKDDCLEKNEQTLTLEREHVSELETEIQVFFGAIFSIHNSYDVCSIRL